MWAYTSVLIQMHPTRYRCTPLKKSVISIDSGFWLELCGSEKQDRCRTKHQKTHFPTRKQAGRRADYLCSGLVYCADTAPDEKIVHLLIDRIEAKKTEKNTDFNIVSTLKPVLEIVVAGAIMLLSPRPCSAGFSRRIDETAGRFAEVARKKQIAIMRL